MKPSNPQNYRLGKPPVIEAWVHLRFRPRENARPWDPGVAEEFLKKSFGNMFEAKDCVGHVKWAPGRDSSTGEFRNPEPVFERVRAATKEEDRFVQAGRNVLVYNLLRKSEAAWPEFSSLKAGALDAYDKYVAFTQPEGIQTASVNYRDIVTLPVGDEEGIALGDFFTIYPEVPKNTFGSLSDFTFDAGLPTFSESGILRVRVKSEPPLADEQTDATARFRLDWELAAQHELRLDRQELDDWLTGAHKDMLKAFRAAFTSDAWALFEPEEVSRDD